ncbi:hypothetical protein TNCV_5058761 [Trichonephila clavipes]|nr:hypothetical protein TNCV_5058761 [Trichonephila clavipes]
MVTANEKWVTYDNIVRKRSCSKRCEAAQTVTKPGLTARKVKARPHTSAVTLQKLWELGWEVLMHTPYTGPGTRRLPPFSSIAKLPE